MAKAPHRHAVSSPIRAVIPIAPGNGLTRTPKTSEITARAIASDIIRDGQQPGDPLPSEATMLDQYDVSRESLREALRLLEVQGLVAIRRGPGGGPTVCTVDPANLGRVSTLYYHLAGATYRELWEAWILAESILAERAAANPDATARATTMAPYVDPGEPTPQSQSLVHDHIVFHAAVASLGRNRVLEITLQTMGQIVSHHFLTTDDPRQLRSIIHHDHQQLACVIVNGKPLEARALMDAHTRRIDLSTGNAR
jgi:GntR family transcriptional regulator, transcriptional repressor for pyruvate dehydrogenase complex